MLLVRQIGGGSIAACLLLFFGVIAIPAGATDALQKAPSGQAELPEMTVDRPDFTESTETLPPGVVQLETGFQKTFHAIREGDTKAIGAPLTLVRIG